jgi:amino acid adenylation domain-containing protein
VSRLLQDYLAAQADTRPDATALVLGDDRLSYAELEAESNRLARMLGEAGCDRGDRVVLLLPKATAAITAMLGVLKADCAYVPIDTDSPASRVQHIIRASEPRLLLSAPTASTLLQGLADQDVVDSSTTLGSVTDQHLEGQGYRSTFRRADWLQLDASRPTARNSDQDLAHLLFTSGSTGVPKGVMITHANVTAFVDWANAYFRSGPEDRWSGHPPLHFDLSTYDIYGALASGAQLHLVPASCNLLPHKLAGFIRDAQLTRWFSVPSTLTFMTTFGAIAQDDFPYLEQLLWCGEVLPTAVLRELMRLLPHVEFTNLYGPTEATIASSYHTVDERPASDTDPIPIGTACDGEELLILDERRRAVEQDEVGDLYIAGVGLSPGYWRDEEKTAAAFVQDPRTSDPAARIYRTGDLATRDAAGLVYFLGRADAQIKHRGYRIELGEIEAALNALEALRECAVVGVKTGGFEGTAICCAYATETGDLQPAALRAAIRDTLPSYMLPTQWRAMDALPKNANGKIDRRTIADWFTANIEARR